MSSSISAVATRWYSITFANFVDIGSHAGNWGLLDTAPEFTAVKKVAMFSFNCNGKVFPI